ncbi:MAG: aminotransferase class V-fold PLP-dependent enzyme [Oscillospiraceae bacterium]|nr:aminotransferase class V-fold PLP-dependent enzyme [Oscillospiraceae bacterium]
MIYLDNGATTLHKPSAVTRAMVTALQTCANPGRGGHPAAIEAMKTVFHCREKAGVLFDCDPEQVVFTANCTHGLNIAIKSLVKPGGRAVISGFEHNAVTRPLHSLQARVTVAGRRLFDWENTLEEFEKALKKGADAAVFTHVSNVFGYILPVEEMGALCRQHGVPFVIDAAQSAGILPVKLKTLGADFIAMPGHKGLLGPQGTGLLLCSRQPEPMFFGGTGTASREQTMPQELPERLEAGTLNVPGIAGLSAGLEYLSVAGEGIILSRERQQAENCAKGLEKLGLKVFSGPHQAGTVSFVSPGDCEEFAENLSRLGIAVRAGLHCAPLAHESAGTLEQGTVRISFGHDATIRQTRCLLQAVESLIQS